MISAWQPGEEGGTALAALLFGDADFAGALAVTAYKQKFAHAVDIDNISTHGRGYRCEKVRNHEFWMETDHLPRQTRGSLRQTGLLPQLPEGQVAAALPRGLWSVSA